MSNTIIFTEIVNCGPVGRIMLESFHKYHDRKIGIWGMPKDIEALGEIKDHPNNDFLDVPDSAYAKFGYGHSGTAELFAMVFDYNHDVIHLDADLVFKKESISLIENAFAEGYDIVGSRRCYKNNPGKVPVPDGIPDAVSTYFFGMKTRFIPTGYGFDDMCKMWQGHPIGVDHMIMDFGDPVYFNCLKNGAKTKFLDSNLVGGQDINGSKVNNYKSNLHLDMGEHLSHWGGVGTGYAVDQGISQPEKSYADWARTRWLLFAQMFYDHVFQLSPFDEPTKFDAMGRWISGRHNEDILNLIKSDLAKTV